MPYSFIGFGRRRSSKKRTLNITDEKASLVFFAVFRSVTKWKEVITRMLIEFDGDVWYWRGPAPHHFVTVPSEHYEELSGVSGLVTYGWGMIPATVRIGKTEWKTSLFPKDGGYIVPLKASVRTTENIEEGDTVTLQLRVNL